MLCVYCRSELLCFWQLSRTVKLSYTLVMLIHWRNCFFMFPREVGGGGGGGGCLVSMLSFFFFFFNLFEVFWNWSRTKASSLNVTSTARANLVCKTFLPPTPPPLLFPTGVGVGGLERLNAIILWFCLNLAAREQETEPNVLPEWTGGKLCNKRGAGG